MSDVTADSPRRLGPNSVNVAVGLWLLTVGMTGVLALISLFGNLGKVRSEAVVPLSLGIVLAAALPALATVKFKSGNPVARVFLVGLAGYYTWGLVIDISAVVGGRFDDDLIIVFLIEIIRTVLGIAAAIFSLTPTMHAFFREYNADDTRSAATLVGSWAWGIAIAAIALRLGAQFFDNLPGNGRSWTRWTTSSRAATTLALSLWLCLLPGCVAMIRQFQFGRQWARVTLTVLGGLSWLVGALFVVDAVDEGSWFDLVTSLVLLLSVIVAIVWSYFAAVNAHFRRTAL